METWIAYRDTSFLEPLETVTWLEVQRCEAAARDALRMLPDAPPDLTRQHVHREALDPTGENELQALRAQVEQLQDEIAELVQTKRDVEKQRRSAAILDITKTLGYINAAMNTPNDPVIAYRAGMVYAAQLIAATQKR